MIDYSVIALRELLCDDEIDDEKIAKSLKKFSCSKEKDLENFLVKSAVEYEKKENGKTFFVIDNEKIKNGEFEIVAFFTTGLSSVDISNLSRSQKKKLLGSVPGRDNLNSYPAYLIGQLGQSDNYCTDDICGEVLLNECVSRIKTAQRVAGGKLVVLECREKLRQFYKKQGFKELMVEKNGDLTTCYKRI